MTQEDIKGYIFFVTMTFNAYECINIRGDELEKLLDGSD